MPSLQKTIELLAPAKTAEIGIAAIQCGADAVYLSAEKFGARREAGNRLSDIEKLVQYAHLFYARVYVTLNTILTDRELEEAFSLIRSLDSIGIDGLIIQDVGLLELPLPSIPLIASTQMNNDSLEKIQFLEKVGFSRVVLPREMTLKEIHEVRMNTAIQLECFIHGALCVCYSGQCYLSHALGGRSANRGHCAQPCRRRYSLVDEKGTLLARDQYLLSLKDLNRSESLTDLIDAGVTSFKIEGRLKDESYVRNTVGFYRKKIDRILTGRPESKKSSGTTTLGFIPDVTRTFNRGFTDFGLKGNVREMACHGTPKSQGQKMGTVKTVGKNFLMLTARHDLKNGDGICFFDARGVLQGSVINRVESGRIYPDKMAGFFSGALIFRNHDHAFVKALSAKGASERRIKIDMTLEETREGFSLSVEDEEGHAASFAVPAEKQAAQKKAQAEETIQKQLSKVQDTIFVLNRLRILTKETYFIPVSVLNALRRGAIAKLLETREANRPKERKEIKKNSVPYPLSEIDYRGNCLNQKAIAFYTRHGAKVTEGAAESGLPMSGRCLMRSKYCVKRDLGFCQKETGTLFLLDEDGKKFRLEFDCASCRMSVFA